MASQAIKRRNANKVACSNCGHLGLQWVNVDDPAKVTGAWDPASPKSAGWKYVPYGTDDFSGTVHSLRPETCHTNVAAVMPNDKATVPEVAIGNAPAFNDALLNARVDKLETDVAALHHGVDNANVTIINVAQSLGEYIAKVNELAKAPKVDDKLAKRVDEIAKTVADLNAAKRIEISVNAAPAINVGRQHYMYANLVAIAANVDGTGIAFMQGERGAGKSHVVEPLAKTLGYDMDTEVEKYECSPDTSAVDVFGFFNANGVYVETAFYRAYTQGKLLFIDELPRAMADAIAAINSLTSGDYCGFPNGMQKRHPRFRVIAAGNTSGRGASDDYEGNKLDAATLSRLVYVPWDTDWSLMGSLSGFKLTGFSQPYPDPGAPRKPAEYADWGSFVMKVANTLPTLGITSSVSARAIINGAKLLAAGLDQGLVEYATIWGHMSPQDADTVKAAL